ncbi:MULTISPECIES: hypothetical protein [Actinosynnema]|uniref:hypothetical protein n=1 Tax=Actinosynnema TaxID=40566 RepID=UPI0020A4ECE8|nr:hypothetical protein [Actinosynnema pretiosum]MCP2095632.1 hypothetical protein [Actinosynnema pretiosum]
MTRDKPLGGVLWLFAALFLGSLTPLALLDLDGASQLAGVLALPVSIVLGALAILVAERPELLRGRTRQPVDWARGLKWAALVLGLVGIGAVGYAVWDATRPLDLAVPEEFTGGQPWRDGEERVLELPGSPPERDRVVLALSLENARRTGDCERSPELRYTPVVDGQERAEAVGRPGQAVELSLEGAKRQAVVKVVLDYSGGNTACEVRVRVDEAVLRG